MVDTIVLRVHDRRKHENLVKYINTNFKGTSKNTAYITKEEEDTITNSPTIDGKRFIDYYWKPTTGTHLIRFKSQERLNNSGHYYLHVYDDFDRNFIEFNFSVPKYVYGTNVLMFTEHHWSKNFNYCHNSSLKYNLQRSYDLLMSFIQRFFKNEFAYENIVDFSDVEVNRVDISYNQVFDNKKYALQYLEFQKKLRKKNIRVDSNNFREYETSLMYTTKRYSLKIYHKGTEYNKHDRKEHEKINKQKGYEYFNIPGLQFFADRILRYEVTFRDTMLSYLFNHNVFRKKCPVHKAQYEVYKKVESARKKNDNLSKKICTYRNEESRQRFIENHPYIAIDREKSRIHQKMSILLGRNRRFLLKTNSCVEVFNSKSQSGNFEPRALFSKALFIECAKFFKDFVNDFQVRERPPESILLERIERYNSEHYYKLPKKEILKFYALLQNSSFDEIMKKGYYSRASFFRYKKRFSEIGIDQTHIMLKDFINVQVDLGQYHHSIIYSKNLINKKS
jgi:hypothetical protein